MNREFARWTRRTAFQLSLTQVAINHLLQMLEWEDCLRDPRSQPSKCLLHSTTGPRDVDQHGYTIFGRGEATYLERRGLLRYATKIPANEHNNYVLTEAGTLVAKMLKCAGFEPPRTGWELPAAEAEETPAQATLFQ